MINEDYLLQARYLNLVNDNINFKSRLATHRVGRNRVYLGVSPRTKLRVSRTCDYIYLVQFLRSISFRVFL